MKKNNISAMSRLHRFSDNDKSGDRTQKVLIIEDNPLLVKLYSAYLKNDYYIDVAFNGYDAIKKVTKTPPHLILLDIMMPDLDGFSVAREVYIKKIHIPIIVLTAKHLNKGEIDLLYSMGIKSYFQKDDITAESLLETINKTLAEA